MAAVAEKANDALAAWEASMFPVFDKTPHAAVPHDQPISGSLCALYMQYENEREAAFEAQGKAFAERAVPHMLELVLNTYEGEALDEAGRSMGIERFLAIIATDARETDAEYRARLLTHGLSSLAGGETEDEPCNRCGQPTIPPNASCLPCDAAERVADDQPGSEEEIEELREHLITLTELRDPGNPGTEPCREERRASAFDAAIELMEERIGQLEEGLDLADGLDEIPFENNPGKVLWQGAPEDFLPPPRPFAGKLDLIEDLNAKKCFRDSRTLADLLDARPPLASGEFEFEVGASGYDQITATLKAESEALRALSEAPPALAKSEPFAAVFGRSGR